MEKYKNTLPILFLAIVWFIFSSPYFLKGNVPYPSTYQVNSYNPWSAYKQFWGPVKNAAMPDVIGQIYPWKHFTINTWKENQMPLWNPYGFSGNPHLADFQSAVFSPFNLLFFIFPFSDAWAIFILLQPLIAGLSMYIFMKTLKISIVGSFVGSISFMFCGFITVWMAYGTLSMAIAFLPLALFAIEKTFTKVSMYSAVLLSLTIICSFFSGHFQTSMYFLLMSFSFLLFKSITTRNIKACIYGSVGFVLGISVALLQIIPSIGLYEASVRSGAFIKDGGIPIQYIITVISPDFYGNPVTRNDWFGAYAEWASFIGIVPLFLSCFVFFNRKKETIFFIVSGIIALLLAMQSPLQGILGNLHIPVFSTSNPSRIIVLFSFCFAVLAGMGFDALKGLVEKKSIKKIMIPFSIIGLLLLFIWFLLLTGKILSLEHLSIAKRNLIFPSLLFFGSIVMVVLALIKKRLLLFVICYLLLATSIDSFRFVQKWMPFDPKSLIFTDLPILGEIKKNINQNRLFGNIGQEIGNYYSFQMIEGYDPLYIKQYGEFIRAASTGNFQEAERSVVHLDKTGKYTDRVLDFLGVLLLTHRIQDTKTSWAYPVWEKQKKYSLLFQDNQFQLYKNNTPMQRATIFYTYQVIKNNKALLQQFFDDNFNFREVLLLEEEPLEKISKNENGEGSAKIISYSPNKIRIYTTSNTPALLLLTDNFYPGWKARVNGKENKIYRANYTFRAVAIPAGKSTVEFTYESLF